MTLFNGNMGHRMNDSISYDRLFKLIEDYQAENSRLRRENANLSDLNQKLWNENARLRHEVHV